VTLQDPATGGTAAVLYNGDLVATPATVTEVVNLDSSGRTELSLLNTILPVAAGIVGAVALVAGIVLLVRKPRKNAPAEPGRTSAEVTAGGPEGSGGPAAR
jgi:hypothetical protein